MMIKHGSLEQSETQILNIDQQKQKKHKPIQNGGQSQQKGTKSFNICSQIELVQNQEDSPSSQYKQQQVSELSSSEQPQLNEFDDLKHSLKERMDILYNQYICSTPFVNLLTDEQIDQSPQIELVEQYIVAIYSKENNSQLSRLLLLMKQFPLIREFLQWIYDAAPIFFYQQLILVTCNLTLAFFSLKTAHPLVNLTYFSQNISFLSYVFNNTSLKFFRMSPQPVAANQFLLSTPFSLLAFISYFTQKFFEMIEMNISQSTQQTPNKELGILGRQQAGCQKKNKRKQIKKMRKRLQ